MNMETASSRQRQGPACPRSAQYPVRDLAFNSRFFLASVAQDPDQGQGQGSRGPGQGRREVLSAGRPPWHRVCARVPAFTTPIAPMNKIGIQNVECRTLETLDSELRTRRNMDGKKTASESVTLDGLKNWMPGRSGNDEKLTRIGPVRNFARFKIGSSSLGPHRPSSFGSLHC